MIVLIPGTGGVSCFAIQIAALAGATVIATSSSEEKPQVAKKLGATHFIDYHKNPYWADEVLEATNGVGVHIAIDVVGAGSIEQTLKATRFGGAVVTVGLLSLDLHTKVDVMVDVLFGSKTI